MSVKLRPASRAVFVYPYVTELKPLPLLKETNNATTVPSEDRMWNNLIGPVKLHRQCLRQSLRRNT